MADGDDIPPLEDMSELLQQVEALREQKSADVSKKVADVGDQKKDQAASQNGDSTPKASNKDKEKKEVPAKRAAGSQPSTFGGFKKGFLFGGTCTSQKSSSKSCSPKPMDSSKKIEELPYIKPKDPEAKEKQYQMPEVQEAMKASQSFLDNKEWITDDLLQRIEKSPNLIKYLGDPRYSQALAEFQRDPKGAQMKYGDNPEVQFFFKEFCGLLGDHFTKLGASQDTVPSGRANGSGDIKSTQSPAAGIRVHNPNAPTPNEESKMQEILARPDIREILVDPEVQQLFEQLRTNPSEAQKILHKKDRAFHQKISKLVEAGLLKFQM